MAKMQAYPQSSQVNGELIRSGLSIRVQMPTHFTELALHRHIPTEYRQILYIHLYFIYYIYLRYELMLRGLSHIPKLEKEEAGPTWKLFLVLGHRILEKVDGLD